MKNAQNLTEKDVQGYKNGIYQGFLAGNFGFHSSL